MSKFLEKITLWLLLLLILNIFTNVILRYLFNNSLIALQELEWHLFAAMFLLGISYTLNSDAHVRVDIFYAKFNTKKQATINIIGAIIFIIPISILIVYYGSDFTYQSFLLNETSSDPGGLAYRFVIKSIIPISFIMLIISSIIFITTNYKKINK